MIKEGVEGRRIECHRPKRKNRFVKDDMSGENNLFSMNIKTPISFAVCRIAKKSTLSGFWRDCVSDNIRK